MALTGIRNFVQKLDKFCSVDCYVDSGHRRSARAIENVNAVNNLGQSQGELPRCFSIH